MQNQDNTNLIYGGFFVRLAAYFVDIMLMGIVLLIVKVPIWITSIFHPGNILQSPLIFQFSAVDIVVYILSVLYFIIMTYLSGATIGKKLFRLKVITTDQSKLTLINVIYRETIGRYLSTVILWIGYFLIGVDTQKKGLHDILCDTRVIYDFGNRYNQDRLQKLDARLESSNGVEQSDTTLSGEEPIINGQVEVEQENKESDYLQLNLDLEDQESADTDLESQETAASDSPMTETEVEETTTTINQKKYQAATYYLKKE